MSNRPKTPAALPVLQHLPIAKTPTASVAGRTLAESTHQWRQKANHLRSDAPNVLIIMLDDVGFAHADTVGGAIHTPTLSRVADTGVRYNAFHTTAISSATRASLLTGRNHHRVESGTITEFASDFDGYVLFDSVPYGDYRLRIGAASAAALGVTNDPGRVLRIDHDHASQRLGRIKLELKPLLPPMALSP